MDDILRLYYEGNSFENTMSLQKMYKVLEGLKDMSQVIYGSEGYEIYIHEIRPGSCDIKALFKEYGIQVSSGFTVLVLGAMLFTQGKSFTYKVNGNNNSITIVNFENESMEFSDGMQLPRILQSSKFRSAGQKLTAPIEDERDKLTINQCEDSDNKVVLTSSNKRAFVEKNDIVNSERIRGRMYEINIDAESFKIDLPNQERKFTVNIDVNAEKAIGDFIPYIGTNDIHLIGIAKRNMEGEIINFSVIDFEVAQHRLIPESE